MEHYDAVIVGAGPAGGQCARDLASKNRKVLLIDKAKSFLENNYSSGGAPIEIMNDFALPSALAGTNFHHFNVYSTNRKASWNSSQPFGPILDFDRLRSFLAEETMKNDGIFQLNNSYISHEIEPDKIVIQLKEGQVSAKVLVDATGTERKVLNKLDKKHSIGFTGIEYHIKVSQDIYQIYADSLNFYLGHKWMPQGYAWIFSKGPQELKVGVVRYFQNLNLVPHEPSYTYYMDQLLSLCGTYEILDRHGKTIHYVPGQHEKRYEGPVLAIGDAISTLNPLGCEGIRHAMFSGKEAALAIDSYLDGKKNAFKGYDKALNKYFGTKWFFSEQLMKRLFTSKEDETTDRAIAYFGKMNNQQIMDVLFHYKFSRSIKSYFRYILSLFKSYFSNIWQRF